MFNYLVGKVTEITDKTVTLFTNGFGFQFQIPQIKNLTLNKETKIYTYMHWNQEKGPSFYGFQDESERQIFLMIIDCPKIGPSIALSVLSQMSPGRFIEIITSQNEEALSSINGIGEKKAEQIIMQLKRKVSKLISSGQLNLSEQQQDFTQWQNVSDVLVSLNYSKSEISKAMMYLTEKYSDQNYPLDQLIRSALSFLSSNRI